MEILPRSIHCSPGLLVNTGLQAAETPAGHGGVDILATMERYKKSQNR
ncbi:hypothetical protein [Diaphorobacter aerolatus]|uniref:Uncharacterized protein n=1 Tax=Diaphorobacter aerolatus TaxID=1288495 RepID=A0A7H0GI38_9BURK|nr:hypothetical protein [Diaphorobacter aerolatus]QNP47954.1 hypothetical protein H9K75_17845 [Diaphorobacter aerolatus]